jgi:hypothetical protein
LNYGIHCYKRIVEWYSFSHFWEIGDEVYGKITQSFPFV